jgi:hypothetical protein
MTDGFVTGAFEFRYTNFVTGGPGSDSVAGGLGAY